MNRFEGFKTILFIVEANSLSLHSAKIAIDISKRYNARLVCLDVVDTMMINKLKKIGSEEALRMEIEIEENGWKYLYHIDDEAKDEGVITLMLQEKGIPDQVIIKVAQRINADLILLALPISTGPIRKMSQGYVEKVIEHSKCPVLVIRTGGRDEYK